MNDKSDLLNYFLKSPSREYHVRELAKITKKSPNTISKHLKFYANKKILLSENKHGRLLFRANTDNRYYKIEKIHYNLYLLEKSGIIDYLNELFENPTAITLFGSCANGENLETSDIDLLIVSSLKKEIPLEIREKFQRILGCEIQMFNHSENEIKKMIKKESALLNSWANGIVIRGFLEVIK